MGQGPTPTGGMTTVHEHDHEGSELSDIVLRVRALEVACRVLEYTILSAACQIVA